MKISVSKLFDANTVIEAFVAAKVEGIEDFVSNLADLSDQMIRALRQRISLADNIDCLEKNFRMTSGTSIKFLPPDQTKRVRHIIPTRVSDFENPILSVAWKYVSGGEIEIRTTMTKPLLANDVSFLMFY